MTENLRVGGEGRHFDEKAAEATEIAVLAQRRTAAFLDLIREGKDAPPSDDSKALVSDYLLDPQYDAEIDLFFRACHLTVAGKYEAGSAALLAFCDAIAERFGVSSTLPE